MQYHVVTEKGSGFGEIWHHEGDWYGSEQKMGIPQSEEASENILVRIPLDHPSIGLLDDCSWWAVHGLPGIDTPDDALGDIEYMTAVQGTVMHWPEEEAISSIPLELAKALQELGEVPADAEEDGLEPPSDVAVANARRLLEAMYRISPRRYTVYPTSDAYIAIDARGVNDGIVVVMCGSDGAVLCLATIDQESRRARYASARRLPDGFIREALHELKEKPAL